MNRFSYERLSLWFICLVILFSNFSYAGELIYSTYLGGTGNDYGLAGATDSAGNIYLTGYTASATFPTDINAYDITYAGGNDAVISKFDPTGTNLVYSTYLGGAGAEYAYGITVDTAGNVYVTGYTASADFPTKSGSYDRIYNTGGDSFVTKLNSSGTDILASTYLGGTGVEYSNAIKLDSAGEVYVTGYTASANFPTLLTAFDTSQNGNNDVFVTKFSSGLSGLLYSTFLGGTGDDRGYALALDSSGNAYLTGYTVSADFPTSSTAYDTTANGNNDVFVSKLNTDGTGLTYSTYLGGSNVDYGYGIGVDTAENAIVAGYTSSNPFPRTWGAFDTTANGNNDIFVTKLNSAGTGLVFSTYLGGSSADRSANLILDKLGNIYITGYTASNGFPITSFGYDTTANGNNDVFITRVHSSGTTLLYSSYFGGSAADYGSAISVDDFGNAYVVGYTASNNFPVTTSAYDTTFNGGTYDVFASKFQINRPPNVVNLIAPTNGTSTANSQPRFIWSTATDPDYDQVTYQLQLATESTFTTPVIQTAFGADTEYTPASGLGTELYYWQVITRDSFWAQNTSAVWTLTVINNPPAADFYGIPTCGFAPLSVNFFDTSTGVITNWFWTFGDGSTSTLQNPSHSYLNYGNYTVTLIVQNVYAASTMRKYSYISVIVPMLYSTYLGGSGNEEGYSIAIDSAGNAYLVGYTASANFPTTAGVYDTTYNTNNDVFITKINSAGTGLLYSTYLGGSNDDRGIGIRVDNQGNAYITGFTYSNNFPVSAGAYDTAYNFGGDAFLTELNNTGSGLIYSTYLGSGNLDQGEEIALDTSGNAYVTGYTYAPNYPVTSGAFDTTFNGSVDGFVSKINPALTGTASLIYSTFVGGSYYDYSYAIAVDNVGNAYVTGYTQSTNFPVSSGAYDTAFNGSYGTADVFVSKLNPAGTNLVYSTYFGGTGNDYGSALTVDTGNNAFITGYTASTNLPITFGAFDTTYNGGTYDAFIAKLNSPGSALVYATYLGGTGIDSANNISLDNLGNAYIIGATASTNFPTTANGYDTAYNGGANDAFFSKINTTGTALKYSTYLGGNNDDAGRGIVVGNGGNIYMTGYTASTNFPTTSAAFDTSHNGSRDVFATKICFNNQPSSVNLLAPSICTTNNLVPTFIWSKSVDLDLEDTVAYQLQLSTDTNFASGLAINLSGLTDTTYTVSTPLRANKYYWKVISLDPLLARAESQTSGFIAFDTTQQWAISSVGTAMFYLGTWASSTDYTPVTFRVNSVTGTDTVTLTVFDAKHPNANDSTGSLGNQHFISRWVRISKSGGISSANITLTYTEADFADASFSSLPESALEFAKYSGSSWSWYPANSHDTTANWIKRDSVTSFSDWTLSAPGGVPVELSRFEAIVEKE